MEPKTITFNSKEEFKDALTKGYILSLNNNKRVYSYRNGWYYNKENGANHPMHNSWARYNEIFTIVKSPSPMLIIKL